MTHPQISEKEVNLECTTDRVEPSPVNQRSLASIQHQRESPVWGAVKETIQCKQLSCDTAQLRSGTAAGGPAARQSWGRALSR